jgi:predicted patatin/cPLA2 family phospholipase
MPYVKNLVISGGGIKGIGFLGILKYLNEYKLLDNVESYTGTSIGSIISLLLIIEYTNEEIYEFCKFFNWDKVISNVDIDKFITNYGFESSYKFVYVIRRLLENKNIPENITFKELYERYNKELNITGVCLSDNKLYYFNKELTPDMKILIAINISCNIPILFEPVKYDNKLWADGGLLENYAINYYKSDIENTLGMCIFDECQKEENRNDNVIDFMFNLVKCVAYGSNNMNICNYRNNTITLSCDFDSYGTLSASLSETNELYDLGYNCAKKQHYIIEKFIKHKSDIIDKVNDNLKRQLEDDMEIIFQEKENTFSDESSENISDSIYDFYMEETSSSDS